MTRRIFVPAIFSVVLLAGCTEKSTADKAVDSAVKRYDRVATGMSKQDVVGLLGEPMSRKEGVYRWEVVGRPLNRAAIDVRFDRSERVASIARSRAQD